MSWKVSKSSFHTRLNSLRKCSDVVELGAGIKIFDDSKNVCVKLSFYLNEMVFETMRCRVFGNKRESENWKYFCGL